MPKNDSNIPSAKDGNGPDDDGLGDAGKRALQAERDRAKKAEADAKAARDELAKIQADQTASQSQMDKVLAKLDAAEKRATEADRRALHGEVVAATGLSMAKVARLKGETVEELMADAAEVFDWKPKDEKSDKDKSGDKSGDKPEGEGDKPPNPYARPREALKVDPGSNEEPAKSPQEMADAILQRRF